MKCVICKNGRTRSGKANITLVRDKVTVVIRNVPAKICENCGEEYLDEKRTGKLLKEAERAASNGTTLSVQEYLAA